MKNTFELEHVGINTDNAGEAEQLALLLCKLFNLEPPPRTEVRVCR